MYETLYSPAVRILIDVTDDANLRFDPEEFTADVRVYGPERAIERYVTSFPAATQPHVQTFVDDCSIAVLLEVEKQNGFFL
jgi:hypothetical protein